MKPAGELRLGWSISAPRGEMTISDTLNDADGGTALLAVHDNLPPGVPPDQNEIGRRKSRNKLTSLVEAA